MPRLAVTISTFDTPPKLLRRAVDSVLAQDYDDFDLFVINDGGTMIDVGVGAPRATHIGHSENIGRYATEHEWLPRLADAGYELWAPLDSDDIAGRQWLARLVALRDQADADVAFSAQVLTTRTGVRRLAGVKPWDRTDTLRFTAHMSGVWRLDFLEEWALTNPNYRVGWDTMMTLVPWVVGEVAFIQKPLVQRISRPGSLTRATDTGFGSPMRRVATAKMSSLFREVVRDPFRTKEILENARLP